MNSEGKPASDAVARVIIDAHKMDFYSPEEYESEPCAAADAQDAVSSPVTTEPVEQDEASDGQDEASGGIAPTSKPDGGPLPVDRGLILAAQPPKAKEIVATLEQSGGMNIADLAADLEVHANTVRAHVDDLLAAGLIKRRPRRSGGRGRPQWIYSAVGKGTNHEDLMRMLSAYVRDRAEDPVAEARHIGHTYFEPLSEDGEGLEESRDPRASVREKFVEQGFSPEASAEGVHLLTCPVLDAARENPEVVCSMHLGMTQRLWTALGGDGEVGLSPFAGPGWCSVRFPRSEGDQG